MQELVVKGLNSSVKSLEANEQTETNQYIKLKIRYNAEYKNQ